MNLRLRLIVAFFLLSVVPLAAVTAYTYAGNARAMRETAGHEAELLAGELTQRMQIVTAQLGERVQRLVDMSNANAAAASTAPPVTVSSAKTSDGTVDSPSTLGNDQVVAALGEVVALFNNIDIRGVRGLGGRGGRGGGIPPNGRFNGPPGTPTGMPSAVGGPSGAGNVSAGPANQSGSPSASTAAGRGTPPQAVPGTPSPSTSGQPPAAAAGQAPSNGQPSFRRGGRSFDPNFSGGGRGDGSGIPQDFRGRDPNRVAPSGASPDGTGRAPSPPAPPAAPSPSSPAPPTAAPGMPVAGTSTPSQPAVAPSSAVAAAAPGATPGGPSAFQGPPPGGFGPRGGPPPDDAFADPNRIRIDMNPIRREIMQQFVADGQWDQLSAEERQKIIGEVNQRLLGIAQGIQMGAAEFQKKVVEVQQKAADAKAAEIKAAAATVKSPATTAVSGAPAAPAPPAAPDAPAPPAVVRASMQRKTAISGSRLDVTMEKDGEVVNQVNAEINLPNLLATVFGSTRHDRGELPFAVGKDGHLFTPSADVRQKLEQIDPFALKPETKPGTEVLGEWIVVTTADPTGSGLKFGIARPVGDSLHDLQRATARNGAMGLGFICLALVGIVPLSSRLTKDLSKLSDGVRRIAQGDFRARVEVGANDEVGRLARAFNQMAEDVEAHQRSAVEQERIKRELELGRQIQHDMLPHAALRFGLTEIQGVSVPAREVGGDFFNYFQLPNGSIALLVGDVSGKGVGAALLMANIQASLRTRLAMGQSLADLARELDADVEANTPGPVYATLFVGILNPATRELRFVNAGHNMQYILRPGGQLGTMESSGLPVGLLAGRGYAEQVVQLAAGDLLFFYTDGCVEAESDTGEMFGPERLEALLKSGSPDSAAELLARVEAAVASFRGNCEPFDDATMMAVKVG